MATYKRWPIGLQSGPTGQPTGIGEVIRVLTDNGIAMFSASSDSMSILYDLQKERLEKGVPHTGNYIPTGYVDGYHLSVPEYGVVPGAEAARRHWDMVEKRGLPPEIDWNEPCIWLSTWNEPRPFLRWARMDSGTPDEDPVDGFAGNADWMGWMAVEVGKEALRRGYRWAAFGFAGGDPEPGFWEAPGVLEYLRLCERNPDRLGVALHEYSHVMTILNNPDKIGRFRRLHAACDKHGISRPVIQIKEFGWAAFEAPPPETALKELVEVAKMYMAYPNIHGAAIWSVQEFWGNSIRNDVKAMIPYLKDAALRHAQLIAKSGLPTAVPAVQKPRVLRPAIPVSSGSVIADFLNFRTEPSVDKGQATVISVLPSGTNVGILSKLANGWFQVQVGDQQGYVAGRYISTAPVVLAERNGGAGQPAVAAMP